MNILAEGMHELLDSVLLYIDQEEERCYLGREKPYFGLAAAEKHIDEALLPLRVTRHYFANFCYAYFWLYDYYLDHHFRNESSEDIAQLIACAEKGQEVTPYLSEIRQEAQSVEAELRQLKIEYLIQKHNLQPVLVHNEKIYVAHPEHTRSLVKNLRKNITKQAKEKKMSYSFDENELFQFVKEIGDILGKNSEAFIKKQSVRESNGEKYYEPITQPYIASAKAYARCVSLDTIGEYTGIVHRAQDMYELMRIRQMGFLDLAPELAWQLQMAEKKDLEDWLYQEQDIIYSTVNNILAQKGIETKTRILSHKNISTSNSAIHRGELFEPEHSSLNIH